MNIMNKWKRLVKCLFNLFDPSDSPMEEEISTTGPTDSEENFDFDPSDCQSITEDLKEFEYI